MRLKDSLPPAIRNKLRQLNQLRKTASFCLDFSSPHALAESFRMFRIFRKIQPYTMVELARLKLDYELSHNLNESGIPGDLVECGVYNGGVSAMMAHIAAKGPVERESWLFDSFEGLPRPTEIDGRLANQMFYEGWCEGDVAKVEEIFDTFSVPRTRVHIVKGWFKDTFPTIKNPPPIALLRIDADWYESVKLCLEKFYDHVQPGGYVVLDDYGAWEGCRKATQEFITQKNLDVHLIQVDYTGYYFQKTEPALRTAVPS